MTKNFSDLDSFGDVAAEQDAVLDYFVATNAVRSVADGSKFLVLGRKGTGKTAIVRHFTEGSQAQLARPLNLRGYPWSLHARRIDYGASDIEAYVASWRYLIAVQLASLVITHINVDQHYESRRVRQFLSDNYGGSSPTLGDILRPNRLTLGKFSLEPSIMGNALGSVEMERSVRDHKFGLELEAVTKALLHSVKLIVAECGIGSISLHFDELDQGLSSLDEARAKMMIGLILAAREVRREGVLNGVSLFLPVVYLRDDLWNELEFSDKNKINQSLTLHLEWDSNSLKSLIDRRVTAKLGAGFNWDAIASSDLMRGSQTKWNHIIARTFERPRDVISFCNLALGQAKLRSGANAIVNKDIVNARVRYSRYLKQELDDEVVPHWPQWEEALQACSAISTLTFERGEFETEYTVRKSSANQIGHSEALELMYSFSIIGYEKRYGYGGTGWAFRYSDPDSGWDNAAARFKVHAGLKEFAKLRENRSSALDADW